MKRFKYISLLAFLMPLFAACSDDTVMPDLDSPADSNAIVVSGSFVVDDICTANTRSFADSPSVGLKITVLEFKKGNNTTDSYLQKVYEVNPSDQTNVANGTEVAFKLSLDKTDEGRIVHFIVSNDFIKVNTNQGVSEAMLIPSLTVSGGTEAYWGRLVFDNGYCTREQSEVGDITFTPIPAEVDRFKKIPLVRNFSKITVENAVSADNFDLLGFELINVPTSGTVAPWRQSDLEFPVMLDNNSRMLSYKILHESYKGIMPGSAVFRNTESEAKTWNKDGGTTHIFSRSSQFLYEHPYESTRRTYMIVYGRYSGSPYYYKLDLGTLDGNSQFQNYDILRNYEYVVTINRVTGAGATTVEGAIDGFPYNNLSGSVEARNMLNISDGQNMILVNFTSHAIVTDSEPITFMYQYRTGVDKGSGTVSNNANGIKAIGLEAGEVIGRLVGPETVTVNNSQWVKYTIYPNEPSNETKNQSFTIIDDNGLSRAINLTLRNPWEIGDIWVTPGAKNTPDYSTTQDVSGNQKAELTVYFNLPDGIPEFIFPLTFQLESDRQNIENNPIGTLVVSTGETLFKDAAGKPVTDDPQNSYLKTVSYKEYVHLYKGETNEIDESSVNSKHRIRCRFKTIWSLSSLPGSPDERETTVAVYNPYFNFKTVAFMRKKSVQ